MNKKFDPCIFCKSMIKYFKLNTNYDSSLFSDLYQECVLKVLETIKNDAYVNKRFLFLNLKRFLREKMLEGIEVYGSAETFYLFDYDTDLEKFYYTHLDNFTLLDFVVISIYRRQRKPSITKTAKILGIPKDVVKNILDFYKGVINV